MEKRALIAGLSGKEVAERIAKILEGKYNVEVYYPEPKGFYFKGIKKALKTRKKPLDLLILITSGSNLRLYPFFRLIKSKQKIFFPYDITYFYSFKGLMRILNFIERGVEKQIFLRCDKIIHKGLEEELSFLPFYDRIKDKPSYLFREFINPELIQEYDPDKKLSKKDGEIHLVYGGKWNSQKEGECEDFFSLYSTLLKEGIQIHVYSDIKKEEVKNEFKKYSRLHLEGYKKHEDLIKEYTKYDYGLNLSGSKEKTESVYIKTAFSNKTYDYLHAKIPVIVLEQTTALSELIKKNKIGLVFDINKIEAEKIKDIKQEEYLKFIHNIDRDISKNKKYYKLIKFIEKEK